MNIENMDDGRLYFTEKAIREKDLVKGHVYIEMGRSGDVLKTKGFGQAGLLLLFLGRSSIGTLTFYTMGSVWIDYGHEIPVRDDPLLGREYTLAHSIADYENQIKMLNARMHDIMRTSGDKDYITGGTKPARFAGEYRLINFEDSYFDWYQSSFKGLADVPDIANPRVPESPVRPSELVPGSIYYTQPHGFLYAFLGRTSDGGYLWFHLWGSAETIQNETATFMVSNAECTNGVKRCWPLSQLPNDPFVDTSPEAEKLAKAGYQIDMSDITQYMLDNRLTCDFTTVGCKYSLGIGYDGRPVWGEADDEAERFDKPI